MALINILDVLFSEEEQRQIENDLKELVRARLKQPLTQQIVAEESPAVVKKRKKNKWSEEARAAQAERARIRFSKKENDPKPINLSGSDLAALRAIKGGCHWPSEIASRLGSGYPTIRAQNMLHDLEKKGLLVAPKPEMRAYFEITEKGIQILEENSIPEKAEVEE